MAWFKAICTCVGCAVGIGLCVVTGGAAAPLVAATAAPYVIGGAAVGGYFLGNQMDNEASEKENRLMEDQHYRDAMDERNRIAQGVNDDKNLLIELVGKRNGSLPRKQGETDESLDAQIAVVTNSLKNGENRLAELNGELDRLRKELGGFSLMKMLGLDKMKTMDKIMLVGGVVLIIYLLKS